jgi:hypothetical protein
MVRAAVLPDMERWRDNYVLMVFDGEPTADHERVARLPADEAKRIAGAAAHAQCRRPSSYLRQHCYSMVEVGYQHSNVLLAGMRLSTRLTPCNLALCLDTAHAAMTAKPEDML